MPRRKRSERSATGASLADIYTDVERDDDGSVKVAVSWIRPGDVAPGPVNDDRPV